MHSGMTSKVARFVRKNCHDISAFLLTEEDLNNDVLGFLNPTFDHCRPIDNIVDGPAYAYGIDRIPLVYVPSGGWVTLVFSLFTITIRLPDPSASVDISNNTLSELPPRDHPHLMVPQRAVRIVTDGGVYLIEGHPLPVCVEYGWRFKGGDPQQWENWSPGVDRETVGYPNPLKLVDGSYNYWVSVTPDKTRSPVSGKPTDRVPHEGWAQACVDEIRAFRVFASPTKRDGEKVAHERCWEREMGKLKNAGPTATARQIASGIITATHVVNDAGAVSLSIKIEDI